MSDQDRSAKSGALRHRIAGAIFAAAESMGISDRDVKEKLTQLTIERLERGEAGLRLPFMGMEELVPKGGGVITDHDVKRLVKEALQQMGGQSESPAAPPTRPAAPARKPEAIAAPAPVDGFSPNALRVLEKRYLKKDAEGKVNEKPEDMFHRVARSVAAAELIFDPAADAVAWEDRFYLAMIARDFLPNSPTLMNAGRELGQLSACFVLPVDDTMESIFDAVKYTALIHKSGGGTGFSFNRLRPENDRVGTTGGVASGPVSFIRAFDTATEVIKQGGMRRGANMAVLNVDHPDVLKFISAKEGSSAFNNFNFSVAITEDFMKAVEADAEYDLINPRTARPSGRLKARQVFDTIVDKAWKTGDPGIVFLDRINRDNPAPKLGKIESTNPCGEQPLLPYESCNLGSINLARMLRSSAGEVSHNGSAGTEIDYARLAEMVRLAVRFLDDVIEVNVFPLPEIERRSKATRKVGLGVMGFADMLIKLGISYDSQEAVDTARQVMHFVNTEALSASRELAEKRGSFPTFKKSVYFRPGEPPLRNATRTTIAPTGTLSIIADCSSGIEPLFALSYTRTILEGEQLIEVNPYFRESAQARGFYSDELVKELAKRGSVHGMAQVPEDVQRLFVTAHDITPEWHVKMQAAFQESTDNAVSKTVNFPHHATREDVARVFKLASELGCKGVTIYRDRSKGSQVLSFGETPQSAEPAVAVSPAPRSRPRITTGFTKMVQTGCGHIYVTVNRDERGICEVFSSLGKSGGCAAAQLEAISRLISLALRSGIDRDSVVKHLRGIRCPSIAWEEGHAVLSCPDAIASVLEQEVEAAPQPAAAIASAPVPAKVAAAKGNGSGGASAGLCPECSNVLVYQEGCHYCLNCGYTKC